MAGNALQVEAVDAPATTATAGERGGPSHSATIYWWQIALLAARVGALERELEGVRHERDRERRRRERVIDRYEQLLAERGEEIERLEGELESERSGSTRGSESTSKSGSANRSPVRSLFSR